MDYLLKVSRTTIYEAHDTNFEPSRVRVYSPMRDCIAVQIRSINGISKEGRSGVDRRMLAHAELNADDAHALMGALRRMMAEKGWASPIDVRRAAARVQAIDAMQETIDVFRSSPASEARANALKALGEAMQELRRV